MDDSLKDLHLKCNKLLQIEANYISKKDLDDLTHEIDAFQLVDRGKFVLLSATSCLRATIQVLLELLGSPSIVFQDIVPKVLSLMISFCANDSIKRLLVVDYELVSKTISLLSSLQGSSLTMCLQLLETLSYGVKEFTSCHAKECEVLLKYCTSVVLSGKTCHLLLCMELIINICSDNTPFQIWLKQVSNYESFQQKIVSFLTNKNISIIVTTLHVLAILSLKDPLGSKIFKSSNMGQTLQLTLSILCTSFDYNSVKQAVDLFIFLLSSSQEFQCSLAQYAQFSACIQKGFRRLNEVDGYVATKILEVFVCLLKLSSDLSDQLLNVLFATETRVTSSLGSLLEFLQEEEVTSTAAVVMGMKFIHLVLKSPKILSMLKDMPDIEECILSAIVTCKCFTTVDCNDNDELLHTKLRKQKEALTILSILRNSSNNFWKVASVLYDTLQYQLQHNPVISGQDYCTCSWSTLGLSVGINSLYVMTLYLQNENRGTKYSSLLKDRKVLSLISCILRGKDKTDIYLALSAMSNFQDDGSPNEDFSLIKSFSEVHAFSNEVWMPESMLSHEVNSPHRFSTNECHESKQLEEIIEKFKSCVEIRDVRASEIMSMYEHKLQNMVSKENHLQDLLDTKSQAMTKADRLLKQYRTKMNQYDAECHKLRSLLQVIEEEREGLKDKIHHSDKTEKVLSLKINQLEGENMQLRCTVEEYDKLKAIHHEQMQRLQNISETAKELEIEKQKLCSSVNSLEAYQLELQKQLSEKKRELADTTEHYKTCLKNLRKDCEVINEQLNDKGVQLQAMTDAKVNLEKEFFQVSQALKLAHGQIHQLSQKEKDLQDYTISLETQLRTVTDGKMNLEREISKVNLTLKSAQEQIQLLSQKEKELQDYSLNLETQLSYLKQTERDLQDQVCTLKIDSDLFSAVKSLINKGQNGTN